MNTTAGRVELRTRTYITSLGTVVRQHLGWDVQHKARVEHIELSTIPSVPLSQLSSKEAKR